MKFEQLELRKVYQQVVCALMNQDERIVLLDADLVNASASTATFAQFPTRCYDVGISEANMMGVAAGLSFAGMLPMVHTFAPFATRRAYDQIMVSLAYGQGSCHIYGSDPGVLAVFNGATHTSFEDLALMRALPNVQIYSPADPYAFAWILRHYQKTGGLIYTRASRKVLPTLYDEQTEFASGQAHIVRQGTGIAFVAEGIMVHEALRAAAQLTEFGLDPTVVDLFSIKPYDHALIHDLGMHYEYLVSLENHQLNGGIGDAIGAQIATEKLSAQLIRFGIHDRFGQVGTLDWLLAEYGLSAEQIVMRIREIMNC